MNNIISGPRLPCPEQCFRRLSLRNNGKRRVESLRTYGQVRPVSLRNYGCSHPGPAQFPSETTGERGRNPSETTGEVRPVFGQTPQKLRAPEPQKRRNPSETTGRAPTAKTTRQDGVHTRFTQKLRVRSWRVPSETTGPWPAGVGEARPRQPEWPVCPR